MEQCIKIFRVLSKNREIEESDMVWYETSELLSIMTHYAIGLFK
ncbi:MAG: hypothetical protein QM536_04165 [Chitinophagaceae bacterium]|nr:hypothetical protein [Chitinophagaceae bacterium]